MLSIPPSDRGCLPAPSALRLAYPDTKSAQLGTFNPTANFYQNPPLPAGSREAQAGPQKSPWKEDQDGRTSRSTPPASSSPRCGSPAELHQTSCTEAFPPYVAREGGAAPVCSARRINFGNSPWRVITSGWIGDGDVENLARARVRESSIHIHGHPKPPSTISTYRAQGYPMPGASARCCGGLIQPCPNLSSVSGATPCPLHLAPTSTRWHPAPSCSHQDVACNGCRYKNGIWGIFFLFFY